MKLSCLIVDDEPLARHLLEQYVTKIPQLDLLQSCGNPVEAIEILRENTVDILFLDIQMPEITGISLLKILQNKPYIVLTTAYSEYALEGYELDVTDYLLKPITFERFLKAIDKVQRLATANEISTETVPDTVSQFPETAPAYIFVKDGTKLVKIKLNEIMYVEGLKDYVSIYTPTQKIVTLLRIKNLEEQLPETEFVRIHNSYIVALNWIDAILKEKVQIGNNFLPVSDTYRKSFKDFIDRNHIRLE